MPIRLLLRIFQGEAPEEITANFKAIGVGSYIVPTWVLKICEIEDSIVE
jgi:hypothetical protein